MKKLFNKHKAVFAALFLAVLTLAVYWQVHDYDFLNYDDNVYVTDNSNVQSGLTLENIRWAFKTPVARNWHPLTCLSLMLDHQLFGLNAGAFHMTNLFFHTASSLLLFLVFYRITGKIWHSSFIAALFALHPLHVESVAWISERKDVLSTFFWILTILVYLNYCKSRSFKKYLLVVLAFVLGLLSKAMLVTLPFTLLLLDYWPLRRLQNAKLNNKISKKSVSSANIYQQTTLVCLIKEKVSLFVLSAVFCIITFLVQQQGGTMRSLEMLPLNIRIANALFSYIVYIQKMIIPIKLAVLYPHPGSELPLYYAIVAAFVLIGISIVTIRQSKKRPYLIVGWLWYLGTLLPVIGLVQVGAQAMADRYTYIPFIGLFIIIAWAAPDILARWRYRNIALTLAACLIIPALAISTWLQVRHWENSITIFAHTVKVTNNNYTAYNNLASSLDDKGDSQAAVVNYLKALEINPNYLKARFNLGNAFMHMGKLDEAFANWEEVLRRDPDHFDAHYNIAAALNRQGKFKEAAEHYRHLLRVMPGNIKIKNNLALAIENQQKAEQILKYYEQANTLAKNGQLDGATDFYLQALQINPNFVMAHNNLANAYLLQGEFDKCLEHYSKAIEIDPDFTEAHYNLGILFQKQDKIDQAAAEYHRTLQINPSHAKARKALENLSKSTK